jgi:rhodanese-related sulfurtransferase
MDVRRTGEIIAIVAVAAGLSLPLGAMAADQAPVAKPTKAKICMGCHPGAEPGQLRGEFDSVAMKSQSIQLKIDTATEVVKFDKKSLKLVNASAPDDLEKSLRAIKKGHQVRAEYTEKDGVKTISLLSIKPALKVPAEKIIKTDDVAKIVALGPEKGNYLLVDSRPKPKFVEGAIPTAINIPFSEIKKSADKLPADKSKLVVFYCAGPTCALSPQSATEAEKMGYTNVKVYHEGYPAWSQKNFGVVGTQALKEAWLDKDLSFVLLDVRPAAEAKKGFIKGAVNIPEKALDKALKSFPNKELKPPFVIYDAKGDGAAERVARKIVAAGYPGPRVLTGGFAGWEAAKYTVTTGKPATKVAYVPKPKAGTIAAADFNAFAKGVPATVQLIDVRNPDEVAESGAIKGALNIPADLVAEKLAEVPRDKELITYCNTGARAEMAYNILKDKGFKVRFLDATVATYEDGTFKISK